MSKNIVDHLVNYAFQVGEVVTVGGNPNVLAEVIDISDSVQVAVRILTPPQAGKTIYTTRFTYYTTPMPHLTAKEVREKFMTTTKREIKLVEPKVVQPTDVEPKVVQPTVVEIEEIIAEDAIGILEETFEEIKMPEKTVVAEEDFMQLSLF